jgi:hypothetical protein
MSWTDIFMTTKELWDKIISICFVGAEKCMGYEVGRIQISIKDKGEWRRKLSALGINEKIYCDEAKSIVEVIKRRMKSWEGGQQLDWMVFKYLLYPQQPPL